MEDRGGPHSWEAFFRTAPNQHQDQESSEISESLIEDDEDVVRKRKEDREREQARMRESQIASSDIAETTKSRSKAPWEESEQWQQQLQYQNQAIVPAWSDAYHQTHLGIIIGFKGEVAISMCNDELEAAYNTATKAMKALAYDLKKCTMLTFHQKRMLVNGPLTASTREIAAWGQDVTKEAAVNHIQVLANKASIDPSWNLSEALRQ